MDNQKEFKFTIPLQPITKKNSPQMITNPRTGKPMPIPSKQYRKYHKDCKQWLEIIRPEKAINQRINLKAIFYMGTRRKADLTNLHQALHDILVDYKIIEDDNYTIVHSTDGSRVRYDKEFPHTEVTITFLD